MVVIITDGDIGTLEHLYPGEAQLLVFIRSRPDQLYDEHTRERVYRAAEQALAEGGTLIVADSLPEAMELL